MTMYKITNFIVDRHRRSFINIDRLIKSAIASLKDRGYNLAISLSNKTMWLDSCKRFLFLTI
jgi:hypothetical protein